MVIKASSGKQVNALVGDLASADDVTREAAMARLIGSGSRAVPRIDTYGQASAANWARVQGFSTWALSICWPGGKVTIA